MTFEEIKEAVDRLEEKDRPYSSDWTFRRDADGQPEIAIDGLVTLETIDDLIAILQAMKELGQADSVGVET